jgi:hypothetical protein
MDVIDSKMLARDAGGKPVATFPHPALERFPGGFTRSTEIAPEINLAAHRKDCAAV